MHRRKFEQITAESQSGTINHDHARVSQSQRKALYVCLLKECLLHCSIHSQRLCCSVLESIPYSHRSFPTMRSEYEKLDAQLTNGKDNADVVIIFAKNADMAKVDAVCRILKSTAEISVRHHITNVGIQVLFISARWYSLLKYAESTEMPKRLLKDFGGALQSFSRQNSHLFQDYDDKQLFFSKEERQMLSLAVIENIRVSADTIKASPVLSDKMKLRPTQPLVPFCMSRGIIGQVLPLHDQEKLRNFDKNWVRSFFSSQPLNDICDYFGVKLAIYFAWLGHYTRSLLLPTIVGIIYWMKSFDEGDMDMWFVLFALFNIIWSTLYLEGWKRRSAELAFRWGTLDLKDEFLEEPRSMFQGEMGTSEVTGKPELQYPEWKRQIKRFCVGWPVIMLCIVCDVFVLWSLLELQFWWESSTKQLGYGSWTNFAPKVLLVLSMGVMENIYKKIASHLNEFENYRLEETYQNHLIVKLALFQFINSFGSLFYIAFYLRDMQRLRKQMAALLIVRQVIGNIKESLIPFLKGRLNHARMNQTPIVKTLLSSMQRKNDQQLDDSATDGDSNHSSPEKTENDLLKRAEKEAAMPQYEGTFEDYLEMFIQFGYVILFSSAFPLAALCAWLNNIIEIRSDAFKLCSIYQKPFPQRSRDIGTWQDAMELMGVIGVMVNCALIGMSGTVHRWFPSMSTTQTILFTLTLEHVILSLKLLLAYIIPDIPEWVQTELARTEYRRREALKCATSASNSPSISAHSSPHRQRQNDTTVPPDELQNRTSPMIRVFSKSTANVGTDYRPPLIPTSFNISPIKHKPIDTASCSTQWSDTAQQRSSASPRARISKLRSLKKQMTMDETLLRGDIIRKECNDCEDLHSEVLTIEDYNPEESHIEPVILAVCKHSQPIKATANKQRKVVLEEDPIEVAEISDSTSSSRTTIIITDSSNRDSPPLFAENASTDTQPTVSRAKSQKQPGSVKKPHPGLRLLERTRSLSHILHRPRSSSIGNGSRIKTSSRRPHTGGGTSSGKKRRWLDGRAPICEETIAMPEQPFGELSFLQPDQIVALNDRRNSGKQCTERVGTLQLKCHSSEESSENSSQLNLS